jgi:predicted Zn finger-like uncharacterized protein
LRVDPSRAGFRWHVVDDHFEVFMPGGIVTQCPACSTKLKLKEMPPQGKKLRCPKCSEVFAPSGAIAKKSPKREVDEFGPLDDSSGSLDPFDAPAQGRQLPGRVKGSRGAATKAPPRRKVGDGSANDDAPAGKAKKTGQGANKGLLLLVGGLSFCVMFVVGCFAFALFSRGSGFLSKMAGIHSGEGIPAKYLPNAPEVVICVRVADLFGSSAAKEAMADEEIKKPVELFGKAIGLQPKDIDSVILAIAASPAMRGPKAAAGLSQLRGMSGEDTQSQTRCVVIVRSKKPFDQKAFGDAFKVAKMDNDATGKTQFSGLRIFRRMESSMVAFPERNVMLLGSVLTIEEILANPSPPVPELDEVDPKQHVILAVMPTYWPKEENLIRRRDDGPTGSLIRGIAGSLFAPELKLSSVGLTFGKSLRIHMQCLCASEKAAEAKKKAVAEDIAAGRHSGIDEEEEMAAMAKGKAAAKPKPHLNPLSHPGLYDFSETASDKSNSLKWADEAGSDTLDFTAVLTGDAPKVQVPHILRRLTFYQPNDERF